MKKITSKLSLVLSVLFISTAVFAQNTLQGNNAELVATQINKQIMLKVKNQKGLTAAELAEFSMYYSNQLGQDKVQLFKAVMTQSLNNHTQQAFVAQKEAEYAQMVDNYRSIKLQSPQVIKQAITPSHHATGTCNPALSNIDFATGTLADWQACWAQCSTETSSSSNFSSTALSCVTNAGSSGAYDATTNSYQVTVMSGGNDPVTNMPVVYPGANHSARVGDGVGANYGVGELEQTFQVSAASSDYFFWNMPVLEETSHPYYEQPYVCYTLFDQFGDTIGNYMIVSSASKPNGWFETSYQGSICYYQPWNSLYVSLKKYIGTCVTLIVRTSDCGEGYHFGYTYFSAQNYAPTISVIGQLSCNKSAFLQAPFGAASYKWSGPNIIGSDSGENLTIGGPGKYTVILKSIFGKSCADTLDAVINASASTSAIANFKSAVACTGSPTKFTNTTPDSSSYSYAWQFGDGGTSNAIDPLHTFTTTGTFTVALKSTNGSCVGDTTFSVLVNPAGVTAAFTFDTVCQQLYNHFTDQSTGTPLSWSWNFGDGYTSTSQNPTHVYYSAGTFTVTLITGGGACADTVKHSVIVKTISYPLFSTGELCFGTAMVITNGSTPSLGTTYTWNLGDGTINYDTNINHTYTAPGKYAVMLTAMNASGCIRSATDSVVVDSQVHVSFTVTSKCLDKAAAFYNTTIGPLGRYDFFFGDGSGGGINPTHPYATAGTYTVGLESWEGVCYDSVLKVITVRPLSHAKFATDTVCLGALTTFTNTTSPVLKDTYNWDFGDGSGSSTASTPTYTYGTAGIFKTILTATDSIGCSNTDTGKVIVNSNAIASFAANTVCVGTTTIFTDKSTGGPLLWKWNFGDGNSSSLQNTSHTYLATGKYATSLITGSGTCADTVKDTVIVLSIPIATVVAVKDSVCPGIADTLIASGGISYSWTGGATSDSLIVTRASNASYTVSVSNGVCSQNATASVTVKPIPTLTVTGDSLICGGNPTTLTASGALSYSWIGGGTNAIYTDSPANTTTYTVTGLNKYGCSNSANYVVTVAPNNGFDLAGNLQICIDTPSFNSASIQACIYNTRCLNVKGTLKLLIDTALHFTSTVADSTVTMSGDTLMWTYNNLSDASPSHCVSLNGTISTLPLGDSVFVTMLITPTAGDSVPSNNNVTYWVRAFPYNCIGLPFDPNEKSVLPEGDIAATQQLTYTIHFQNTGTAIAHNVVVIDTLSPYLDPTTFKEISSSSDVVTTIKSGNIVSFTFNNINLPDTGSSKTSSVGVVQYTIKPLSNAASGDMIKNKAGIYFDANPVVLTNTTVNKIAGAPLSVEALSNSPGIACFPNPFATTTSIVFNSAGKHYLEVDDVTGRKLEAIECSGKQFELSRNGLASGVYFVKAQDEGQKPMVVKIVIE